MEIDLSEIEDDLESNWWQYIRVSSDFAYIDNVRNQKSFNVENDDILIHKATEEDEDSGRRFVVKRYHQILDGEAFLVDGKDAREIMEINLMNYISENNKLPFGMDVEKVFKNKKVKIKFSLNDFDSFVLKVDTKELNIPSSSKTLDLLEIENFIKKLPINDNNPLQEDTSKSIRKINSSPVLEAIAAETGGKIFVQNGEIIAIDKRKSIFQEYETIFYILHVKNGQASSTNKKDTLWRDFSEINVKCSQNAMEKYELEIGDLVNFNGKLKKHRNLGSIIQNIRKFVKTKS